MAFGTLEVIVGCMSSGKSEELLRRLRRAEIAKQSVAVFKPNLDTRQAELVASRAGQSWQAKSVSVPNEILALVRDEDRVVGIDEAHFFDDTILSVAETLVRRGKRVIIVGCDTDFSGQPFAAIPSLMALADSVTKLTAVCMRCGETATRSYLFKRPLCLHPNDRPIAVGGDDMYEARCRECHMNAVE